jgi:hypothetical protein
MVSKPIFELQMEILTSKSARVRQGVVAESVLLRFRPMAPSTDHVSVGHYPGRGRALVTEMTFYDASRRSWCTIGAPPCPAPPAARGPPAASLPAGGSRTERQTIKAAYDLAARGPRDAARMLRGATVDKLTCSAAAAELERLSGENAALRLRLEEALEARGGGGGAGSSQGAGGGARKDSETGSEK